MARTLYDVEKMRRELVACDPHGLETLSVPIQLNQGRLEAGAFITIDGQRAFTLLPKCASALTITLFKRIRFLV